MIRSREPRPTARPTPRRPARPRRARRKPMASTIVPCIWLDDAAEEAAETYRRIFPGSRKAAVSHYPEAADNPAGRPRGSVLTIELELAGQRFTLLDGGPQFRPNPSISF